MEAQAQFKALDDISEYHIVLTINYGHEISQMKIDTWYTITEAMNCFATLRKKIVNLVERGGPINMSLITMTKERKPIYYGITGIVAINHDIPEMELVDEN